MLNGVGDSLNVTAKISAIQPNRSSAGPGVRTEVFFFGCSRGCPGCINEWVQEEGHYNELTVAQILAELVRFDNPRISIGGGEPFEQMEALLALLPWVRLWIDHRHSRVEQGNILLYTGKSWGEVHHMRSGLLEYVDWLCVGPYIEEKRYEKVSTSFVGSSNQKVIVLKEGRWAGEVPIDTRGRVSA